jgi:ferrous iron transport protein B
MKSLVLAGNPNTGKSTVFNMLTNGTAKTGNWHGVTVESLEGVLKIENKDIKIIDLPGLYSLETYSLEERVSTDYIMQKNYDIVVNIADANNLERSLKLTYELLERKIKTALIINMYSELKKTGGSIDIKNLSNSLNIPIFVIDKLNKQTENNLKNFVNNILNSNKAINSNHENIDILLRKIYKKGIQHEHFLDKIFLNKFLALPLFFLMMAGVFYLTFGKYMLGEFLKGIFENFISVTLKQFIYNKMLNIGMPLFLIGLVCDGIINGAGILLSFIPQISILFIFLTIMEESGYISRLAFMTDGIFSKVGLTGRAVFSLLMGFGCTAAAVLTTRGYENKALQKRTIFILPYISCSAKLPVYSLIAGAFFADKFLAIITIYFLGIIIALIAAMILKKFDKQEEEFLLELPPYRFPSINKLLKSLIFYQKQFIIKVGSVVLIFIIIMWFLMSFSITMSYLPIEETQQSILAKISDVLKYMFYPIGIQSWEISVAMLSGLIAKETVAGVLSILYPYGLEGMFSPASGLALLVFVMTYTTCISTITTTAKELNIKTAVLLAVFQLFSALLLCYLTYFLCMIIIKYGYFYLFGSICFIYIIYLVITNLKKLKCCQCGKGCQNERVCSKRNNEA